MANKTEIIGPVRIEPALMEELKQVAQDKQISVYELSRVAMADYVARHRAMVVFANRLMTVADGEHSFPV